MLLISLVIFIIGYELSYLHDPLCVVLALCDMVNISKYKQYSSLIDGCSRAWGAGQAHRKLRTKLDKQSEVGNPETEAE